MKRVVSQATPYTFLEQRLRYARQHPRLKWVNIVENVPTWPRGIKLQRETAPVSIANYASSAGQLDLIEAVIAREKQKYNLAVSPEQVLITNGALHGLSLVFDTIPDTKRALCQAPVYTSIASSLKHSGFTVKFFEIPGSATYARDLLRLVEKIRPGLIYLYSPNNPTGVVCPGQVLQQLAEYCSAKKICLVVDQVYDSFFEVGCPPISPLIAAADWRYLFAVNSLSKNYGAPGLRTGWVISASQNITKLGATLERECVAVAGPSQEAAALLLRRGNQALIQAVKRRKQIIAQHLACLPMIRYCVPEGGVQFYAKLPVDDIEAFADFAMLKFRLILTTAGNFAGATGPYIRIPFCEDQTTLIRALKLLSQALHAWIKHPPRWS